MALAQVKGAFGQSLRVGNLGEVSGDEVGRAAAFGHCRPGGLTSRRIATADDDVGSTGSQLDCHHSPDTRGASGNRRGSSGKLSGHIRPFVPLATS
jgi:hypothetical protein